MAFGDSMIVIQHVCKLKEDPSVSQSSILQRISLQITKFEVIDFFHVKTHLSIKANSLTYRGISLEQGMLVQDERNIAIKSLP